ncbi:MAG TPA: hypothetical protein ENN58_00945, partial [bacterium]|nr:hypothetical protein [bacterium]
MRSITILSGVIATTFFILFSWLLYLINVPPFLFPHIPMFAIFICSEKNLKKRVLFFLAAFVLYSQLATPFPLFFLAVVALQTYIAADSVFDISVFDFSLSALINGIFIQMVLNVNIMIYS